MRVSLNPLQKSIFGLSGNILATRRSSLINVILRLRFFALRVFRLKSNPKYSKETFVMSSILNFKFQISNFPRRGFGLVEALVASGIIVVLASAATSLTFSVQRNTGHLTDRIIADNLGAEAIEVVRAIRYYNLNDNDPLTSWKNGLESCASGCAIDNSDRADLDNPITEFTLEPTSPDTISITRGTGDINYLRYIFIQNNNPDSITVNVKVTDSTGSKEYSNISTILTNWRTD